jgi:hypothetical protein
VVASPRWSVIIVFLLLLVVMLIMLVILPVIIILIIVLLGHVTVYFIDSTRLFSHVVVQIGARTTATAITIPTTTLATTSVPPLGTYSVTRAIASPVTAPTVTPMITTSASTWVVLTRSARILSLPPFGTGRVLT